MHTRTHSNTPKRLWDYGNICCVQRVEAINTFWSLSGCIALLTGVAFVCVCMMFFSVLRKHCRKWSNWSVQMHCARCKSWSVIAHNALSVRPLAHKHVILCHSTRSGHMWSSDKLKWVLKAKIKRQSKKERERRRDHALLVQRVRISLHNKSTTTDKFRCAFSTIRRKNSFTGKALCHSEIFRIVFFFVFNAVHNHMTYDPFRCDLCVELWPTYTQ